MEWIDDIINSIRRYVIFPILLFSEQRRFAVNMNAHFKQAHSELCAFAQKYPEAWEDFPWGHSAFKVGAKIFVSLSDHSKEAAYFVSVKLPISHQVAVTLPFAEPAGYGLGKSGWVTAKFGPDDDIPLHLLKEWIDESYRAIAPKKLLAVLEAEQSSNFVEEEPKRSKPKKRK